MVPVKEIHKNRHKNMHKIRGTIISWTQKPQKEWFLSLGSTSRALGQSCQEHMDPVGAHRAPVAKLAPTKAEGHNPCQQSLSLP